MSLLTNIQAYYKLDESSGNAADATGNGFTLTNNNTVSYAAGKINNGADFGATNVNKSLTNTSILGTTGGGNISMSCWVNVTTAPTAGVVQQILDINGGNVSPFVGYFIAYYNNTGTFSMYFGRLQNNVANVNKVTAQTLTIGTWFHLAYTYDGTTVTLYVNGSFFDSVSASGNGTTNAIPTEFRIAQDSNGVSLFSGLVDEVGVWSRVLTSGEVTSLYNGGAGLQYPFVASSNSNFLMFMPN